MSTLSATATSPVVTGVIRPIAKWITEGKEVSVFHEGSYDLREGKLKYSITSGSNIETGNISLSLYNTPLTKLLAISFITIFKRALLGNNSREHCFLPIFWTNYEQPDSKQTVLLALFARVRLAGNGGKEVVEAKWGIRDKDELRWLEANDKHTREFLIGAPFYRDKMDVYCNHFKAVVTLDPDHKIQSIVLRCVSALDQNLFLDENTCAVSLISVQKNQGIAGFFKLGHASIAWEGIEAGSYFLKWADITSDYPESQPGLAKIRIVNRETPSGNWLVGLTCSRTKELTNRMVEHISKDVVVREDTIWSSVVNFSLFAPLRNLFKAVSELEAERRGFNSVENCLSFSISALQRAKIFLPEPGLAIPFEPNAYLMDLQSNYKAIRRNCHIIYKPRSDPINYDGTEERIFWDVTFNLEDALDDTDNPSRFVDFLESEAADLLENMALY